MADKHFTDNSFAGRFELILKALSLTRGRLAAELGVDKSLVGRWAAGSVHPSAYNLERLTQLIARRQADFTMLDWDHDVPTLADKFGVQPPTPATAPVVTTDTHPIDGLLPESMVRESAVTTALRGWAYEGFWRSTRASAELPGGFFHDYIIIRRANENMLAIRMGVFTLRLSGWAILLQNKIFAVVSEPGTGTFAFSILSGVARQRADLLDGLSMATLRDAGGTPIAYATLLERIGELSGDADADDAMFEMLCGRDSVAKPGSVPPHIQQHLFRNSGPDALAAGGDPILMIHFAQSLSRGPIFAVPPAGDAAPAGQTDSK